jgi:hypothetical protein
MRKILYSPGYGAGWTSWNTGEVAKLMIDYQPIIDALEGGDMMSDRHPAVIQLKQECSEKFGESYVCFLGAENLKVATVSGKVRINEYDGSESYEEEGSYNEWL